MRYDLSNVVLLSNAPAELRACQHGPDHPAVVRRLDKARPTSQPKRRPVLCGECGDAMATAEVLERVHGDMVWVAKCSGCLQSDPAQAARARPLEALRDDDVTDWLAAGLDDC